MRLVLALGVLESRSKRLKPSRPRAIETITNKQETMVWAIRTYSPTASPLTSAQVRLWSPSTRNHKEITARITGQPLRGPTATNPSVTRGYGHADLSRWAAFLPTFVCWMGSVFPWEHGLLCRLCSPEPRGSAQLLFVCSWLGHRRGTRQYS